MSQGKNWCITLNNYVEPCLLFNEEIMHFMVCGIEIAPNTGTKHIQGYVQFKKRIKLSGIKKLWPTCHAETAKGSPDQNVAYCTKEDGHVHGVITNVQGKRNDLNSIKELIDNGLYTRIREDHYGSFIRYRKSIQQDIDDRVPHRREPTELHILSGPTGTGKSRSCYENCPESYWKTKGDWWDGYAYERDVIIDEFYGWIAIDQFLRLCDRYPMQVPVKGGFRQFVSKRIFITTNADSIEEWWKTISDRHIAAIKRRITTWRVFDGEEITYRIGSSECLGIPKVLDGQIL
jgi:hypothetical protein